MSGSWDLVRQAGRAGGAPPGSCLSAEQLVAFYQGELDAAEAEAVREHLAACPACLELAGDARVFVAAMAGDAAATASRDEAPAEEAATGAGLRSWPTPAHRWVAAAALVLAAGFGAWQWSGYVRDSSWRDLAIAKADYPLVVADDQGIVWRGEESDADATPTRPPTSSESLTQAIEPYLRGDYSVAEIRLRDHLRQHPQDPEAALYRGVSLLLLERPREAISPLGGAARAGHEPVASEARWYLAQAYLKVGDSRAAERELKKLVEGASPRRLDAQALLQRIEGD